jgi:hypothetical protein
MLELLDIDDLQAIADSLTAGPGPHVWWHGTADFFYCPVCFAAFEFGAESVPDGLWEPIDPDRVRSVAATLCQGEPHVSQPKPTSIREKIIPIPKDRIRKPPPETWQPDPAGGWQKGGIWVVPIDGGLWGACWSIDCYDGWSAPFGTFDTAEAAMQAVDDGYDPTGGDDGYEGDHDVFGGWESGV